MKGIQPLIAVAIVVVCLISAYVLVATREPQQPQTPAAHMPAVGVVIAERQSLVVPVETHATITPSSETEIAPEVGGTVIEMSPDFVAGGRFQPNQVLLRIDAREYELALEQARARVAQAELRLAQVEAEATQALREWERFRDGEPPALARREPQLKEARAALEAAQADARRARLSVQRTELRAPPYIGRVQAVQTGLGQVVVPGRPVAKVFRSGDLEARLPLTDRQMRLIGLESTGELVRQSPSVTLSSLVGGTMRRWEARITRTEAVVDPRTRVTYAVAEVDPGQDTSDLAVGQFVTARIRGRELDGVFELPRGALHQGEQLYIVDSEDRLQLRQVEVLVKEADRLIISSGIEAGDRVAVPPPQYPVEGMSVAPRQVSPS